MSSREIAELTGKAHPKVKADIHDMMFDLGEDAAGFSRIYLDSMNREQTEYHLDRELTETLLTGYSAVLRRKVIARWRELEGQIAAPMEFSTLQILDLARASEIGRLAAVEQVQQQQAQLAIAAPKVAALDRLTQADGSLCLTDAAKSLGMAPRKLTAWMSAEKWIFKRAGGGTWIAYQPRLQSGMLEHKPTTLTRPDGSEKITEQVRVTAKGLAKLAEVAA
jgi:phage antirepressor YoqD-like protein